MQYFTQSMSLLGTVSEVNEKQGSFRLRCRSGDEFLVQTGPETWFTVVRNIDGLDQDRVPEPSPSTEGSPRIASGSTCTRTRCWR